MNERDMTLGRDWQGGDDLRGWLLCEKLEDVRLYWDGGNAWTRGGKRVALPFSIRAALPDGFALDGGIWCGRGNFRMAEQAVNHGKWTDACRFVAYDAPSVQNFYEARLAEARQRFPFVIQCREFVSIRETNGWLLDVQDAGGEGLVARNPDVPFYERGRTNNFLKIKGVIY